MAHRRGRVGVGRIKSKELIEKKAEELKAMSISSAMETIKQLEEKLTEFAKRHRNEIQNDPLFRLKFLKMCGPLGVDPLQSSKGKESIWGDLMGNLGEFYYELSVKVAEVCIASRSRNGGMISVKEVRNILLKRGTKFQFSSAANSHQNMYSEQDIINSIQKLSQLGSGYRTITMSSSDSDDKEEALVMIISVPMELDNDHLQIMNSAQKSKGRVTSAVIQKETNWTQDRIKRSVDLLLGQGLVWLDSCDGIESYWFPSVWKQAVEDS